MKLAVFAPSVDRSLAFHCKGELSGSNTRNTDARRGGIITQVLKTKAQWVSSFRPV